MQKKGLLKIDRHSIRPLKDADISNLEPEIINFIDEMSVNNINKVKIVWNNAANEAGIKWMIFDRALWLLGSEGKPKNKQDILNLLK